MATTESDAGRPHETVSRLPLVIAAAVVTMVALLTVALLAARSPASYPEGSPEAVLQDFVAALIDEDESTVLALLTPESRQRCASELEYADWRYGAGQRAELLSIEVVGDRAEATVRFRQFDDGNVFGASWWDDDAVYVLERVDGTWLVARAGWPWPLQDCTRTN